MEAPHRPPLSFCVALSVLVIAPAWLPGLDARAEIAPNVRLITRPSVLADAQRKDLKTSYAFERNLGQTEAQVKFLARAKDYTLFLTATGPAFAFGRADKIAVLRMQLVGANFSAELLGTNPLLGKVNYFRNGDSRKQIAAIPTYARVTYPQVYPGVDWVYHSNERRLEYDFVIAPNVNPNAIMLAFEGADKIDVDARGELVVHTPAGELRQHKPVIYQEVEGVRRLISGGYIIKAAQRVGFLLGRYDVSRPLIIDPTLAYSTYLGGGGDDQAADIAVDRSGNIYVAGTTGSINFPPVPGRVPAGSEDTDAFVTKFDADGHLVYSTYLGGPCRDEAGGVAVDSQGDVYVTGRANDHCSWSADLTAGAFVAKLNTTGQGVYFFTFGGRYADLTVGHDIALHEVVIAGQRRVYAYVVGDTNAADFPFTPSAYKKQYGGGLTDAFVAKVNPEGSALVYATFLGGNGDESGYSIAVDAIGSAYVAGGTTSKNFPIRNALEPERRPMGPNEATAFVAKLLPDGSNLVYSTYLGGSMASVAHGIAVDAAGNAYITGTTTATDFPTTPGVVQPDFGYYLCFAHTCGHAFVVKLNASGSARVYSTFLYGYGDTLGRNIAVDANGNAYVTGSVASLYFPLVNAFQSSLRGVSDAFVTKLNADATRLVYSSYLGGDRMGSALELADDDAGMGIAVDALGNAYITGYTKSADFPTTTDAFQLAYGSGMCGPAGWTGPCYDAFIAKISAEGPGVVPSISLRAEPAEVFAGRTLSAAWAGIPAPSASDELRLYPLGSMSGGFDHAAAWMTTGAPEGTLNLQLPVTLNSGWYELRLLSPDPGSKLLSVIARSEPVKVF